MLVKFFRHGTKKSGNTTAKSVRDYLLDDRQEQGTANIIRGDEKLTSQTIDNSQFSSTYTSGCLAFDLGEGDHLTEAQKQEIMASFETALLPDFDSSRYAVYWVQHTDKRREQGKQGRLELNFVFAKVDLATGKHLDIYTDKRDQNRLNAWRDLTVAEYQLKDPNDPLFAQENKKPNWVKSAEATLDTATKNGDDSTAKSIAEKLTKYKNTRAETKELLTQYAKYLYDENQINNRHELIQAISELADDQGTPLFEIARTKNPKHISVKPTSADNGKKPQNIKLDGVFFDDEYQPPSQGNPSQNRTDTDIQSRTDDYRATKHHEYVAKRPERLQRATERFKRLSAIKRTIRAWSLRPTPPKMPLIHLGLRAYWRECWSIWSIVITYAFRPPKHRGEATLRFGLSSIPLSFNRLKKE